MTTTVQFLKDHVSQGGVRFRKGEVAAVPDGVAESLLRSGVVKVRNAPEPTERKEDA